MRRVGIIVLAMLMVTSMVFAGGAAEKGSASTVANDGLPAHKKELIIGSAADINNLNLQAQQDQINNIVLKSTHQTLVFFTNKGTFEPGLATSWEFLDDTHIRFHLDPRAKFSDGSALTSADVKFTIDMAMTSYVANVLTGLKSTTIVDDYTVDMEIEKYNNEFVQSLASLPLAIQSKKAYESGMKDPYYVGSGPYMFDEWVQGEYVRLKKNPNYWREDVGISDYIIFKPILEDSSRVIALQTGEIDVCVNPPINELSFLEADKNITVFEKPGSRLFYFGFNASKAPWNNQKLRQAVASAIDRDGVLDVAVYGKGTPQTTILNRGLWGFYDEMEGFPYNLERAKQLMAEAGYPNGGIKTSLLIANSSPYLNIAQVIQANLKEIGIDVAIQTVDDATLKSIGKAGTHELFLWRWNEDSKVDFVYRDLFYSGSGSNYHHYSDTYADKLIDIVSTEKDQDKRMAAGIELQNYLVEACPQVPLYIANLVIAYNKNLRGEYLYGGGNHDWSHAYIAK